MAYDDIQVFSSPHGGHGLVLHFPIETGQTFSKGDVVSLDLDGQISEGADELAPEDLLGIAMAGPTGPGGATLNNPRTNAAYADGDRIPVVIPEASTLFITQNFTAAGTAFDDTAPTVAEIGDLIGLALIGGVWGVDQGPAAGSEVGRIVDILNARKESIVDTGETVATGTTYYIVFTITAHQHNTTAELIAPTA